MQTEKNNSRRPDTKHNNIVIYENHRSDSVCFFHQSLFDPNGFNLKTFGFLELQDPTYERNNCQVGRRSV